MTRTVLATVMGVVLLTGVVRADEYEIYEALGRAKMTPAQAIEVAGGQGGTRSVVQVELKLRRGRPVWETDLAGEANRTRVVAVDAITGQVAGQAYEAVELDPVRAAARRDAMGRARLGFNEAAAAGLRQVENGRVYKIKLGREQGKPTYEVGILGRDHRFREVEIDAVSGGHVGTSIRAAMLGAWSFDELPAGRLPSGWLIRQNNPTRALAAWSVARRGDAQTPPNVLEVVTGNDNATYNLVLIEGASYRDVDLRVRIRGNEGKLDQGGGLVWRARDENNYYVCRINPLEPNFRVYKVEKGKRTQLQSAEIKIETGRWYTLRATMVGNHITCTCDDRKLLDMTDDTFRDGGMIGLWTKADASSAFDDLVLFDPRVEAAASGPAR